MDYSINKMDITDLDNIKSTLSTEFDDFWSYQILKEELNSKNSYYFVIKDSKSNILGFTGIKIIFDEAELMNIVVKKSLRKIGIGSTLLNYIIKFAKNSNISIIHLEVNEINSSAINLYKKVGFKKVGFRKHYYGENNCILMNFII